MGGLAFAGILKLAKYISVGDAPPHDRHRQHHHLVRRMFNWCIRIGRQNHNE